MEANGSILNHGGASAITVIKVGTGEYCLQTNPNILSNFGPVIATLQGGDLSPGFINANTAWGSVCNPYGGYGVFTANTNGAASDLAFVVMIP